MAVAVAVFRGNLRNSRKMLNLRLASLLVAFLFPLAAVAQVADDPSFKPVLDYQDYWDAGEYRKALESLNELIDTTDGYITIKLIRNRALLRMEVGEYDEAITDMEYVMDQYPQPANTLELALIYKYLGRELAFEKTLSRAASQTRRSSRYQDPDRNLIAMGRIAELMGENPKTLLNAHYGVLIQREPDNPLYHIAAGDLSYRKAGYDVASEYYMKALELEPDNQDALAGLAECYWKSFDPRLEKTVEALTKLNPNHPRARGIQVEQLLDMMELDDGLEAIGEALAINPKSLRFLSLKSAALFLKDDIEGMEAVQEEVLEINPVCSEVFRTTGRLASRHYRFEEAAELQQKALDLDPDDFEARAHYTTALMRLGNELEGKEALSAAFEANPFDVEMYNLLQLMATLEKFAVIEREAFTLKLPQDEAPVLADDALDMLDEALSELEERYAVTVERPVLVEMFDNHDDFMVRSVGLPGNVGHLGICFGKVVTMDSPTARPPGSTNWESVLWHEFVHVITLQKTNNRMERWLSEGISVYEEIRRNPSWGMTLDPEYLPIYVEEGAPTLDRMAEFFVRPKSSTHLMFGYFAAGEYVDFYVNAYGQEALVEALGLIAEGTLTEPALLEAAGVSDDAMNEAFAAHLEARTEPFKYLPQPPEAESDEEPGLLDKVKDWLMGPDEEAPDSAVAQATQERPQSPFTDTLEKAERAVDFQDWERAVELLEEAHEMYPEYTRGDAPLRRLAKLYRDRGERENLKKTLERILAWTSTEYAACQELVGLYTEDGAWDDLARVARVGLAVDPFSVRMRSARVLGLINGGASEEALPDLDVLAYVDTTREKEHHLKRVRILTDMGEFDTARREVLGVLEEAPHYWEGQSLLLEIADKTAAPAAEEAAPDAESEPEQAPAAEAAAPDAELEEGPAAEPAAPDAEPEEAPAVVGGEGVTP